MEQALLELVSNALDAMPKGGTLRLTAQAGEGGPPSSEVLVEVADTGGGIPDHVSAFGLRALLHDPGGGHRPGARYRQAVRRAEWRPSGDSEHAWSRHHGPGPSAHRSGGLSGTVLIVDDERTLARSVRAFLIQSGYDAEVAPDAEQALAMLETLRPDVVFSDVRLPGMNGVELLRRIREFDPSIAVIIMTAYGTIEGAVEAVKLGAFDYLKKPVDLEELKLLADRARQQSQLQLELSYYRRRAASDVPFGAVLGESPAMRAVLEQARQIATLDETPPVLIIGETGTGKGLVARTIHAGSSRAPKPFIEVNCTALPATLMEAELFGHERGAFTDAKESRMGLFEAAEGGFLLLDEVGDVELSLQGKLLKAVEDRTVRRVGGIRDRKIDVRILAATQSRPRARVAA